MRGRLVDVGARSRRLEQHLTNPDLEYLTSDIVPGYDLHIDLEAPLKFDDDSFEIICALDVLEHVENIHEALAELFRITKYKLFLTIPNMACIYYRTRFFFKGELFKEYDLFPQHQGDRHRWLTIYPQIYRFMEDFASRAGCELRSYDILRGFHPVQKMFAMLPLPQHMRTFTILFELIKAAHI